MRPSRERQLAHRRLQAAQDHLKAADALQAADLPAHACFAAHHCGEVPASLTERLQAVPEEQIPALYDTALDAGSLDEVAFALDGMLAGAGNGRAA